jgi:hypothetical protein
VANIKTGADVTMGDGPISNIIGQSLGETSSGSNSYTKVKEIKVMLGGLINVSFDLESGSSSYNSFAICALQSLINGIAYSNSPLTTEHRL